MECKHKYFEMVDGKLRCSVCKEPLEEIQGTKVEDKIDNQVEVKVSKQTTRRKKKRG